MIVREIFSQENANIPEMFSKFLPIAMKVLKINKLPKIELKARIEDEEQPTFGSYVNDEVTIYLAIADRHPVDILRTFAHELVHFKQHTLGLLGAHSGDTGSPEENQAHEVAGVIMRHFNKRYPAYLKSKPLVFEHKKGVRARKFNKKPQKYIEPAKPEDTKEDYHPNDPPPGPEFKPTMPKGTVKVDPTYNVAENFADGKNSQDKGDSKRHGVPTKASVSTLRKVAKQGGRKGQLAHWMANMKSGRKK
jgi:hypothetical protein